MSNNQYRKNPIYRTLRNLDTDTYLNVYLKNEAREQIVSGFLLELRLDVLYLQSADEERKITIPLENILMFEEDQSMVKEDWDDDDSYDEEDDEDWDDDDEDDEEDEDEKPSKSIVTFEIPPSDMPDFYFGVKHT